MSPRPPGLKYSGGIARDEQGRYHVRIMVNRQLIRRILPTRREAQSLIRDLKREKMRAELGLSSGMTTRTLAQCVEGFIEAAEQRGVMYSTADRYRRVGRTLLKVFGRRRNPQLTNADVAEYVAARRADGVTGRTIASELSLLRTFLRGTVGPSCIAWATPTLYDARQAAPKRIPSDLEVAGLFETLRPRPPYYRAALIALLTALRPADVLRIGPRHLEAGAEGQPILVLGMQKRRSLEIVIPVVPMLWRALEGVTDPTYGPPSRSIQSFGSGLRNATRDLVPPWNGINILRHTAATWSAEAGFTDDEVGVLLGHRVKGMARQHYIRPSSDPYVGMRRPLLEAVAERLEIALNDLALMDTPNERERIRWPNRGTVGV